MKKYSLITLIIMLIVVLLFAWAPWMNNAIVKEEFLTVHPELRGFYDECPEPYVLWVPFGRWVGNCEGGWIMSFWGEILFDEK